MVQRVSIRLHYVQPLVSLRWRDLGCELLKRVHHAEHELALLVRVVGQCVKRTIPLLVVQALASAVVDV